MNYIRGAASDPSWAAKLPLLAAEIKRIFTAEELRAYFATITRVGPAAQVATAEQYETMRERSMTTYPAAQLTPFCLSERAGFDSSVPAEPL